MKEKEEKKKRKEFIIDLLAGVLITTAISLGISSLFESNRKLSAENDKLKRKNFNLQGRNKILKEENRKLRKENYEACYHLGKKSITHSIVRIKK